MFRSFRLSPGARSGLRWSDPKGPVRLALGVLLLANLIAAWFVFRPLGGSLDEQERRIAGMRKQFAAQQQTLAKLKAVVAKVDKARGEGDKFLKGYFIPRRTAYSTLAIELGKAAQAAGVKPKDHSLSYELIEGSDTLGMLTITANYEGTYADLIQFVNELDRSSRLLILDALQAQPQQGSPTLNIGLKMNAFLREDGQP